MGPWRGQCNSAVGFRTRLYTCNNVETGEEVDPAFCYGQPDLLTQPCVPEECPCGPPPTITGANNLAIAEERPGNDLGVSLLLVMCRLWTPPRNLEPYTLAGANSGAGQRRKRQFEGNVLNKYSLPRRSLGRRSDSTLKLLDKFSAEHLSSNFPALAAKCGEHLAYLGQIRPKLGQT